MKTQKFLTRFSSLLTISLLLICFCFVEAKTPIKNKHHMHEVRRYYNTKTCPSGHRAVNLFGECGNAKCFWYAGYSEEESAINDDIFYYSYDYDEDDD